MHRRKSAVSFITTSLLQEEPDPLPERDQVLLLPFAVVTLTVGVDVHPRGETVQVVTVGPVRSTVSVAPSNRPTAFS